MDDSLDQKKKDWLIRSSMKILGPYDFDEVVERLLSRHISIIDEIRNSSSAWGYIREHRHFIGIVHQLRSQQERHGETTVANTSTSITKTKRLGLTRTDLIPTAIDDEATPLPQSASHHEIQEITPLEEINHQRSAPKSAAFHGAVSYGAETDSHWIAKKKKRQKVIFTITVSLVVVAIGIAFGMNQYRFQQKMNAQNDLQLKGRLWASQGLYGKAIEALRKASEIAPLSFESDLELGLLYVREGRSLEARRIFEKWSVSSQLARDQVSKVNNGLGLASFKEGDYLKAVDWFEKALAYDASNTDAKLNSYILRYHRNQSALVVSELREFVKRSDNSKSALLLYLLALNDQYGVTASKAQYEELIEQVFTATKNSTELKEVFALNILSVAFKLQDQELINKSFRYLFESNPYAFDQYNFRSSLDQRYFSWPSSSAVCHSLATLEGDARMRLVKALCHLEEQRELDAAKIVEEYLQEFPADPYAEALKVSYLYKIGKNAEALIVLDSTKAKEVPMALYIGLRACIDTDDAKCVMEKATQIYNFNKTDALALYGMAWSLEKQKDIARAKEYLDLSLKFEPTFIPAVELMARLEGN